MRRAYRLLVGSSAVSSVTVVRVPRMSSVSVAHVSC